MTFTLQRILVPVDGSQSSDSAVALAIRLAQKHGAELHFCHAVDYVTAAAETTTPYGTTGVAVIYEALDENAKAVLDAAQELAARYSVRCAAGRLEGRAGEAVLAFAKSRHFDAIVIGTRGTGGLERLFLGSTAETVLRQATIPVFVVHADSPRPLERVLVAVDDSDPSDAARQFATALAVDQGSKLVVLLHVIDMDALYEELARYRGEMKPVLEQWESEGNALLADSADVAKQQGVANVEKVVMVGEPVERILAAADTHAVDLIAIGTHGRRGLRRLFLGSVAEGVIRRSKVPVVVVRGPQRGTQPRTEVPAASAASH